MFHRHAYRITVLNSLIFGPLPGVVSSRLSGANLRVKIIAFAEKTCKMTGQQFKTQHGDDMR